MVLLTKCGRWLEAIDVDSAILETNEDRLNDVQQLDLMDDGEKECTEQAIADRKAFLVDLSAKFLIRVHSYDCLGPYALKGPDFLNETHKIVMTPSITTTGCSRFSKGDLPKVFIDTTCTFKGHKSRSLGLLSSLLLLLTVGSRKLVYLFPVCKTTDISPSLLERVKRKGCSLNQASHIRKNLSNLGPQSADAFIKTYIFDNEELSNDGNDSDDDSNSSSSNGSGHWDETQRGQCKSSGTKDAGDA